jgi:hypothetical protein
MGSIDLAHVVLVVHGGLLAFCGAPVEAIQFFNVPDPDLIFKRLKEDTPAGWAQRYRTGPIAAAAARRAAPPPAAKTSGKDSPKAEVKP